MSTKKRKAISVDEQRASNIYKRKLRSYKPPETMEPPTPATLSDDESKKFTFKKPYPQNFSMPENIIYYISRNPVNPKFHQILIKSCKLLFRISRIIPVKEVANVSDGSMTAELMNRRKKPATFNIENSYMFKLWIYDDLGINLIASSNFASTLIKHIHKCSITEMTLKNQILSFDELQLLTSESNLETIYFEENIIKNADGSITEFEKVFELIFCKNIMNIIFTDQNHGIGKNTAAKMAEMYESETKSHFFQLQNIPDNFYFQSFTEFLKANMKKKNNYHTIDLYFSETISDAYKKQLKKFVNEILGIDAVSCRAVPIIHFFDVEYEEAFTELWRMRHNP